MKKLVFAIVFGLSVSAYAQFSLPAASPRQKVEQQFSMSKITLDYGRPGVKGRTVFGDLVPYGKVWRAGANSSSKITFEQSVNFGGKIVPAGSYGLFITPTANEWKIILNKDFQQWGAYEYDAKLDVIEVSVPVQKLATKAEWFTIAFEPKDDHSVEMIFTWDTVKAQVLISEGKPETVAKIVEKLKEIKQIEREANKK